MYLNEKNNHIPQEDIITNKIGDRNNDEDTAVAAANVHGDYDANALLKTRKGSWTLSDAE